MTDDLKSRLRKLEGGDKYGSTVWYRNPDGPEAADRIEQLQDMNEVMQHQLKELQWSFDCKDDLHQQDYDRMKKYADRIERLEAALREYRNDLCEYPFGDLCGKLNEEVCQGCAAAAALGENQT